MLPTTSDDTLLIRGYFSDIRLVWRRPPNGSAGSGSCARAVAQIGGFVGGDSADPVFRELLVRWYQYGMFCPIFRTHGDRKAAMPPLPATGKQFHESGAYCTAPGGHAAGGPNEIWEFGPEVEPLLTGIIAFRESLRPYIAELAANASATGAPPQRPLFFDFPDDPKVWSIEDEFMFGPEWLVAPVLTHATSRSVYFPAGASWKHHFTSQVFRGGSSAVVPAPLETFPVFTRINP